MKTSRSSILAVGALALVCLACLNVAAKIGTLPTNPASAPAKDEWIQIKSKNFFLVGDASEKDIRKVATRLEQFRETFRLLFAKANLTSPIKTNVVVFKSDSAYKNFKPKRADGKIDNNVAGYFQPGDDVNYITLSTEGDDSQTFSVIFHEYVHFIVNTNFGKSEVPAWFNEGLAEYYSTFAIKDDREVKLGLPLGRHLALLSQARMMPLDTLFNISNYQLLQMGEHSTGIFYAQSWALMHYLLQNGKGEALSRFIDSLLKNVTPEKAFQDAFQIGYGQMETELSKYIGKSGYQYNIYTFKNPLVFDADMQVSQLDEAGSNAYLGDLLYHTNRPDDAEPYLVNALKLQPDMSIANTALGMVRIEQRKFDEARVILEKAIAVDQKNPIAFYRYAYLLSREGRDEFGYVKGFDKETAAKMRESLRKAIVLSPSFTESYELLAFVDIVNNEEIEDAAALMRTALKYQPGNQHYALRLAETYSRLNRVDEAVQIADKISRTAGDPETKNRADDLLRGIARQKEFEERQAAEKKRYETPVAAPNGGPPRITRRIEGGNPPTEAEKAKAQSDAILRSINDNLRRPATGEQRILGHIQKIDCRARPIVFTVKTDSETFTVTSKDFNSLTLNAFDGKADHVQVGCDANISAFNMMVTYRTATSNKSSVKGELIAIEFVPANFRIMTEEEMRGSTLVVYDQPEMPRQTAGSPPPPKGQDSPDYEGKRRALMTKAITDALQKPGDGEKREIGYLDKIECTSKGVFYQMRTTTGVLRLFNPSPETLKIVLYTPDLGGVQFGCMLKPIEFPAVFVYKNKPDTKARSDGEILSVEFVPKSFVLDPQPQ